jgi:hypothetical protein
MKEMAYKFVTWEVPALEELKESKVYQLKQKCMNGEKLSREEKNWISEKVFHNAFSKHSIPLQGWLFGFKDFLKRYIINQYGSWFEYYAFDKTALRHVVCGRIDEIIEVS